MGAMTSLEHKGSAAVDAIVLAGGKGTRLRSVVSDRPKPMAQVAGRPFVEWLLLALRAQGLRRVVLATGYKGEMIASYFGGSWALLMMPFSLVAPEIDKGTFDGRHNGRLTVPNLLLITSGRPAEID